MATKKKRGKWAVGEDAIIVDGLKNGQSAEEILVRLVDNDPQNRSRELSTLLKRMEIVRTKYLIKNNEDDSIELRSQLRSREYYPYLKEQFTEKEIRYFENTWIQLMQQFRSDVLASEELQLKELITVDILAIRTMIDRKLGLEQIAKLETSLDKEHNKPDAAKDYNYIASLEQQVVQIKMSIPSYTSEYAKLLDKKQSLMKELKANRDVRIKRIEDSKSTWASTLRFLEDEENREKTGDEIEKMRIAKNKARDELSEWHEYIDGTIDQPFLTPETVKDE